MCVHCVCVGSLAFHHLHRHLMLWTIYRGRENLNILVQPKYYQLILNDLSLSKQ